MRGHNKAQLFKAALALDKLPSVKQISNQIQCLIFFADKMRVFAMQNRSFSAKNMGVFEILTFEILTNHNLCPLF